MCSGCDDKIVAAHVSYEVLSDGQTFYFHIGCHALWHVELTRRAFRARYTRETNGSRQE